MHKDFTINGTLSGTTSGSVQFSTNAKTISGTGSVTTGAPCIFNAGASTTIAAGVAISKGSYFRVATGVTVTNNGSITSTNNTLDLVGTGTWINAASTSTLSVTAAMTGTGTLDASAADNTVIYAGAGSYTIKTPSASTYHNLTLQGGGTKTAAADLTINGRLSVEASTTLATGTQTITLTSNAAGTASIGNSSGTITGTNWIVQRYIGASTTNWNDLSTPINGNLMSDWDVELKMSLCGGCPDGLAGGWYSVYSWDETAVQDWAAVQSCCGALPVTRGYELWLGTSASALSATTMDSRGTPNFGNQVALLAGAGAGYWSLIGNPYASAISWPLIYDDASTTNLTNFFQVYDEGLSDYAVYDGGTPGSSTGQLFGSGGIMAAHQGFWVENANGTAPALTFKESHKSTTPRPLVRETFPTDILRMRLYSDGRKNACESVIKIQDDASEYFDATTDFSYRKSRDTLTPSLTPVTADNRKVRIKAVPVQPTLSVPVTATFGIAGEYKIDFSGVNRIFKYTTIILEDTETGMFFPLTSDRTYSFTQKVLSKERKFILHFSNGRQVDNLSTIENAVRVYAVEEGVTIDFNFDEGTNTTISICTTLGQNVLTRNVNAEKESITLPLRKNNQLYFVKITTAAGTTVKKIFH